MGSELWGLLAFGVGVLLGRLWRAISAREPPRPNPWEGRSCRDWDGGEHWTQSWVLGPRPGKS